MKPDDKPSHHDKHEAEKRLRAIFDNIPLACHFRDKNYNILECNQMCVDFFNLRDKQEYKERFFDLSPEYQPCGTSSKEKAASVLKEAFETGQAKVEWIHHDGNGKEIYTEVSVVRVEWLGEDHVLAVMRDLTETVKLREVERVMNERLELMLNSSPLACFITNRNMKILEVNKEVLGLYELEDKQHFIDFYVELSPAYQPDGRLSIEKKYEAIRAAFDTGERTRVGWMYQTLSGTQIPCEVILEPVVLNGNEIVICYVSDLREINSALSMVEHLEQLAYVDPLTGAHNRRYFMEVAEEMLLENTSNGEPFSIIMADIDFFKQVNDMYGHDIGDEVLKILVARMRHILRDMVVARYGGEEFIIILPGVDEEAATQIGWRLQRNVTASKFNVPNTDDIAVTASFGVASWTKDCVELADIIKMADKALYRAKATGRNKVSAFSEDMSN